MRLRIGGASIREIADLVGLSKSRVHEILADQCREVREPLREELRALETARYDLYLTKINAALNSGDPELALKAVDRALSVSNRRAKLLGLDAPTRVHVQPPAEPDAELRDLLEQARADLAAEEQEIQGGLPDVDAGEA